MSSCSERIERAGLEPTVYRNDAPDVKIKGDPTLLDRAFGNVLENAQKHAGGVESVCVSKVEHTVRLTVNDRQARGFPSAGA